MQYPVPQFTDVEDKIIGSLTFKQFGIIFGAGVLVFLAYSVSKSMTILILFAVVIGIPALAVAFAKINGRPMYKMFPYVLKFLNSPKYLIFHKEARDFTGAEQVKNVRVPAAEAPKITETETTDERMRRVNKMLEQRARQEAELVRQLK